MSGQPKTMALVLDESDYQAIKDAICKRKLSPLPATESTGDGGVIADICRVWSEMADCRSEDIVALRRAITKAVEMLESTLDADRTPSQWWIDEVSQLRSIISSPISHPTSWIKEALEAIEKSGLQPNEIESIYAPFRDGEGASIAVCDEKTFIRCFGETKCEEGYYEAFVGKVEFYC